MKHTLIKIDLDTKDFAALRDNAKEIYWTLDTLNLTLKEWDMFETARGYHIVLEIEEPLEPLSIVLVQALCGSDLRRETFNMARVLKLSDAPLFWQSRWNVLYSEKLQPEEKKND
jgi:malate synthase